MENLELKKKHKIKLLTMCKILFLEYDEIELTSSFPYYNCNQLDGALLKKSNLTFAWLKKVDRDAISFVLEDKDSTKSKTIHWFELCWTILNKILESNMSPIDSLNTIKDFGICCFNQLESDHPVDRLYGEFLKLKI